MSPSSSNSAPDPIAALRASLEEADAVSAMATLIVAFSGGADSLALLLAALRMAATLPAGRLRVLAAHLDHGLDGQSAARAARAAELATELGAPLRTARLDGPCPRGVSREAFGRQARYAFLARLAAEDAVLGRQVWIATAHHADDQAETVLLRLLFGSGLEGLAAIAPRHGQMLRPFLGLRKKDLAAFVMEAGLEPISDPTNLDLRVPRNRVRALLLPRLEAADPETFDALLRLATTSRSCRDRIRARLSASLDARPEGTDTASLDRQGFLVMPPILQAPALALLHRLAGAPLPPPAEAQAELLRQLDAGRRVACDAGVREGVALRWTADANRLRVAARRMAAPRNAVYQITYTRDASEPVGNRAPSAFPSCTPKPTRIEQTPLDARREESATAHPASAEPAKEVARSGFTPGWRAKAEREER
jgi:tRNA(Ile)-lysidine synthase